MICEPYISTFISRHLWTKDVYKQQFLYRCFSLFRKHHFNYVFFSQTTITSDVVVISETRGARTKMKSSLPISLFPIIWTLLKILLQYIKFRFISAFPSHKFHFRQSQPIQKCLLWWFKSITEHSISCITLDFHF